MHAALIADRYCLDDDLAHFQALVVGLLDEQVHVAQVLPDELAQTQDSPFATQVAFQDSDWSLPRRLRLRQLAGTLSKLDLTLVHALSGRLWDGALALARRLGVPLVSTASCAQDVEQAARIMRRSGSVRVAFTATTKPIAEALSDRLGPSALVQMIPTGVHVTHPSRPPAADQTALGAVITGNGELDEDYEALLAALPAIIKRYPDAQFFLDGQHPDQYELWQAAKRMNLLANVSVVPRRPGHHKMVLGAELLIQPQALGQSRSLTLQAMAQGVPVMARPDPWLDYLIPDVTAWIVEERDPAVWTQRIIDVIEKPAATAALVQSARKWVGQKRVAARQVALTLALYRQITGESFKLAQA